MKPVDSWLYQTNWLQHNHYALHDRNLCPLPAGNHYIIVAYCIAMFIFVTVNLSCACVYVCGGAGGGGGGGGILHAYIFIMSI